MAVAPDVPRCGAADLNCHSRARGDTTGLLHGHAASCAVAPRAGPGCRAAPGLPRRAARCRSRALVRRCGIVVCRGAGACRATCARPQRCSRAVAARGERRELQQLARARQARAQVGGDPDRTEQPSPAQRQGGGAAAIREAPPPLGVLRCFMQKCVYTDLKELRPRASDEGATAWLGLHETQRCYSPLKSSSGYQAPQGPTGALPDWF